LHEMSYCEAVLEAVERRADGRAVARIGVRIGVVHRVVAEAFAQSFELAAAGSVADGAVAEIVTIPVRGECLACGASFESSDPQPACEACGSLEVRAVGGNEVILEWIEYRPDDGVHVDAEQAAETVPEHTHDRAPAHATTGGR
jgi:hydrogenase nickel incorporation protein HypA/HybF